MENVKSFQQNAMFLVFLLTVCARIGVAIICLYVTVMAHEARLAETRVRSLALHARGAVLARGLLATLGAHVTSLPRVRDRTAAP